MRSSGTHSVLPINLIMLTHNRQIVNAYAYVNRGDVAKSTLFLEMSSYAPACTLNPGMSSSP